MVIGTTQKPLVAWLVNTHGVISCVNTDTTGNVYSFRKHNSDANTLRIVDMKHYMKLLTDSLDVFNQNAASAFATIRTQFPAHLANTTRHNYIVSIWNCMGGPMQVNFSQRPYDTLVRAVRGEADLVRGNRRIDGLRNRASTLIMDQINDYIRRMIFDRRKAMKIEDLFEHRNFVNNLDENNHGIRMCCIPTDFELALRWQSRCNSNASSIMARLTEQLKNFVNRKKFIDSPPNQLLTEIADNMSSALQSLFCEFVDYGDELKCKTNTDSYSVAMSCLICALYAARALKYNTANIDRRTIELSDGGYINYKNYKELYLMFERLGNNELTNLTIDVGNVEERYKPLDTNDRPYDFVHPPQTEGTEPTMETQFAKCLKVWFDILFASRAEERRNAANIQFSENSMEDDGEDIVTILDTVVIDEDAKNFFRLNDNPWIYLTEFPVFDAARKDFRTGLYHLLKGGPRTNLANSINPIEALGQKAKQARFSMDPLTISYKMQPDVYPLFGASQDMPFIALSQLRAEVNESEPDAFISIGGMPCVRPQEKEASVNFEKDKFPQALRSGLLAMITEARILLTEQADDSSSSDSSSGGFEEGPAVPMSEQEDSGAPPGASSPPGSSESREDPPSDARADAIPESFDLREDQGVDDIMGGSVSGDNPSPFIGIGRGNFAEEVSSPEVSDAEGDMFDPILGEVRVNPFQEEIEKFIEEFDGLTQPRRGQPPSLELMEWREKLKLYNTKENLKKIKKLRGKYFDFISGFIKGQLGDYPVISANRNLQVEKYIPNRIALPAKDGRASWLFQFGVPVRYVYMNDNPGQSFNVSGEPINMKMSYTPPRDFPIFYDGNHYLNQRQLEPVRIETLNLLGMNVKSMEESDDFDQYNTDVFGKRTVRMPGRENLRGQNIVITPIDGAFSRAIHATREGVACFSLSLPPRLEAQMRRTTDRPLDLVRRMLLSRYRQSPRTWPLEETMKLRLDRFSINELAAIINNRMYIRRVGECDKESKYL